MLDEQQIDHSKKEDWETAGQKLRVAVGNRKGRTIYCMVSLSMINAGANRERREGINRLMWGAEDGDIQEESDMWNSQQNGINSLSVSFVLMAR